LPKTTCVRLWLSAQRVQDEASVLSASSIDA
jgi:hypothetical protein